MTAQPFTSAYRRLGLLVWLSLCAVLGAALLHHASRLPRAYTWFEPLSTLRGVLSRPHFPLAILGVYALGGWQWRGAWDFQASAQQLARALPARELLHAGLRPLSCVVLLLGADALVLGGARDSLDLVALATLGFIVAAHRPDRRQLTRELGYVALSAAIFLAICYAYTILKALTFSSGRSFDERIIRFESTLFGVAPHRMLALWTSTHPAMAQLFDWVYFHFFEHMALTTVLLVALRKPRERTQYLGALALCYLLGGPLYHLLPAVGPSYFEPSYFEFLQDPRLMTGAIRSYLQTNTDAVLAGSAREVRTWGYIACMPSLHVAQELVMLYYARSSIPAFLASLPFTLLTLPAVVALGFHYPVDSLGGALVALVAITLSRWQASALMPHALAPIADATPPAGKAVIVPFFRAYWALRRSQPAAKP